MNRVAVWDADFIPFYVCHSKDKSEKSLEQCIIDCDSLIMNVNRLVGCNRFTGFLTKGKCFRYAVYPNYKGNRKYMNLPKYLNEVKKYLEDHYMFAHNPLYEADDLVLSYKNHSKDDCIIVSPDKDILNLRGTHYNPRKNEFVTTTTLEAETYFWRSMITGDPGDNIKGIKGIGPAGADKIIKSINVLSNLRTAVLEKYCEVFGDEDGITEFYTNFKCLKIVGNIPFDIEYNKIELVCEQEKEA